MIKSDISAHIGDQIEDSKIDKSHNINTRPTKPDALIEGIVNFDLYNVDFMVKLGEGGFGTVRACKFRPPIAGRSGLTDSPGSLYSAATAESTAESNSVDLGLANSQATTEASKFSAKHQSLTDRSATTTGAAKKDRLYEAASSYKRQATLAPNKVS